jgi:hypothetical protein
MNDLDNTIMNYKQLHNALESGSMECQKVVNQLLPLNDINDRENCIKLLYFDEHGKNVSQHYLHLALLERETEAMQDFTIRIAIEKMIGRKLLYKVPTK